VGSYLSKSWPQPADIFGEGEMTVSIATWCCTLQLNMFLNISEWGKLSGCFLWLIPWTKPTWRCLEMLISSVIC